MYIFIVWELIICGPLHIAFFTPTDQPSTAKWLSAEEYELTIARVKSDHVGTIGVLEKTNKKK